MNHNTEVHICTTGKKDFFLKNIKSHIIKDMKLSEFLKAHKVKIREFCIITGISKTSIVYYCNGSRIPSKRLADIIVKVTYGLVTHEDLGCKIKPLDNYGKLKKHNLIGWIQNEEPRIFD